MPRYRDRERERDTGREPEREAPVDFSRAPPPTQKKPEATVGVLVMGDANADWLAYGLEEAYSEKPEVAVVRKHRTDSCLIRYDSRRDIEWAQAAREIIAAEKPKFIVMMIGNNDRQSIREKEPPVVRPTAPKPNTPQTAQQPAPQVQPPPTPAVPARTDAEQQRAEPGPWEFHTEKWEAAYVRRIDTTIAALKSVGVPVIWVGLPSHRNTKSSTDSSYLNDLYRRAEKRKLDRLDATGSEVSVHCLLPKSLWRTAAQ